MKITPKQFALSLYESVDGKPTGQVKAVVKNFVGILVQKNMLAQADKIVGEFLKIWNDKRGIVEASVASANELDKETVKILKNYTAKLAGAKEIVLNEKIDKNILGGVVIKYGDRVVDGSLKTTLVDLKNILTK